MKATIERDRCIVTEIEIDQKKFSTLFKVSFNQHFLKGCVRYILASLFFKSKREHP